MGKDKGRIKEGEERDETDEGRNTDKKTTEVLQKDREETDRGRNIEKRQIEGDR